MRIVHIYDGHEMIFPIEEGSPASIAFELAKHAVKEGHDVTILERGWRGLSHEEDIQGVKIKRIDLKIGSDIPYKEVPYREIQKPQGLIRLVLDRIDFALKANKFLMQNDFDVIHVHLPFAANVLVTVNKKLREKMIYTAHVGEERKRFGLDPSAPLVLKFFSPDLYLIKRIRKSVVLNEPLKDMLVKKGIKEEKLEVIPNGVNIKEFNSNKEEIEQVKGKYGLDTTTVMFAGTVTPRKGVEYLVKAAEILNNKDVIFLIVGRIDIDKEYARKVINYAKEKNLKVKFTGFIPREDIKALYLACDIFVLPSLEEGHGLVLTEAMASGKPLIGTKIGGIPAQIRDSWNGFLVEPGNEKQLAEKINYLIENEEERERMGKNSRRLAEEEFEWKNIAERYLEVYENVAGVS